jgi:hypothetical protein
LGESAVLMPFLSLVVCGYLAADRAGQVPGDSIPASGSVR